MFWKWWRDRRRRKILAQPFPAEWAGWLPSLCRQYPDLSDTEQARLRQDLQLLVAEKNWEGCSGLTVTAEMQVTIAAQVALMSLGFAELPFDRLLSVLIYPDTFVAKPSRREPWGLMEETAEPRLGEAWYQGPVILSWNEVQRECVTQPDGRNVVIHEFAHLLDMANREVDGIPSLPADVDPSRWATQFHQEYDRLLRHIRLGRATLLDRYAATSIVEFFAVGSEVFFGQPQALRDHSPQLYELLQSAYCQDPASRGSGESTRSE